MCGFWSKPNTSLGVRSRFERISLSRRYTLDMLICAQSDIKKSIRSSGGHHDIESSGIVRYVPSSSFVGAGQVFAACISVATLRKN
ncbi:Uncharacterised protein [Chlamydia trachomatis]|nr:Uncharacterised protein [Chlamydia trachomatis]